MFSSTLNFVSSLHDEDDDDDEDLSSGDTSDDDVSSESVDSSPVVFNALSNTEEMNVLFNNQPQRNHQLLTPDALIAVHTQDENNDLSDDAYYLEPNVASTVAPHYDFYLDPFIASNVARLPTSSEQPSDDESSEALSSDDDSASPCIVKTDRSGETTASSLLSIKQLLQNDNSFFLDDGDALMKVISSAMDFGAPPNLMTLYTSGHLSKSQLLNYLRLDSQCWYSPAPSNPGSSITFPIDLTQEGTTSDEPIILDETMSDSSENNSTTVTVIAPATNHLRGDPPSSVRDRNVLAPAPPSSPSNVPFIPQFRDNTFDGSEMNNFSK
jgi:hypothetical protein